MNDLTGGRSAAYFAQMHDLDETLMTRWPPSGPNKMPGGITVLEACAERVQLFERHLAECRRLRGELDKS